MIFLMPNNLPRSGRSYVGYSCAIHVLSDWFLIAYLCQRRGWNSSYIHRTLCSCQKRGRNLAMVMNYLLDSGKYLRTVGLNSDEFMLWDNLGGMKSIVRCEYAC